MFTCENHLRPRSDTLKLISVTTNSPVPALVFLRCLNASSRTDGDVHRAVSISDLGEGQRRHVAPLGEGDADGLPGVLHVQGVGELGDPEMDRETGGLVFSGFSCPE